MELDVLTVVRYFLCNAVINFIMFLFLGKMYDKRYGEKWTYILSYLFVVVIRTLIACIGIPPLNIIVGLICINIVSILFYQCKFRECILYNFSFVLISLFADIMGTALISAFIGNTIDEVFASHFYKYIGSLFNCILQILFSRWLLYFFKKDNSSPIRIKEIFF